MNKGKQDAQSYEEMTDDMTESKKKGLAVRRGNSLYKAQSGEYQEDKLKELVAANTTELAKAATKEKVALENIEEVQKRTIIYLRACEETGTFPSMLGLARSFGYSSRALNHWRQNKPKTETAQWLEMFSDCCADILSQSALKNNANSIVSIFLSKSMYGLRETNELVITPNTVQDDEEVYSADEIRKRYMINENDEEGTEE